jgi:hypothetical protein
MKTIYLLFILFATACANSNDLESKEAHETTAFVTNDTIPPVRDTVSKKPVTSCMVPIGHSRFDHRFGVNIYETPKTLRYTLDMHYRSLNVTDTPKIPKLWYLAGCTG